MATLAATVNSTTPQLTLSAPVTASGGDLFLIDTEELRFLRYQTPRNPALLSLSKIVVERGASGTTRATHNQGATVYGPYSPTLTAATGADVAALHSGVVAALDVTAFKINGVATTPSTAAEGGVVAVERSFAETSGTGTYTATVVVPAGATVLDVIWRNTVVWGNAGSASLVVGDDDDANGYIEATDIKTAPAADTVGASAGLSSRLSLGATIGAYKGGAGKYCAAQKTITATVTTGVGTAATGRSRLLVVYTAPSTAAASKA
jgi:hypothetical protein